MLFDKAFIRKMCDMADLGDKLVIVSYGIYALRPSLIPQETIGDILETDIKFLPDGKVKLRKNMDLELSDIFRSKEQKIQAVKLMNLLQQKQELNQKEIADSLGINDMNVSRLLTKLEAYDYIQRKRGAKKEFIISLK